MRNPKFLPCLCLVIAASLPAAMAQAAKAQTAELTTLHSTPSAASSATVVPMLVRYSGVAMRNDSNASATGANITFLIFKDEKGGEPLWIEAQNVTTDPAGRYEVYLGSTYTSGLPPSLFGTGEARWLEVQIAGEAAAPRTLLTSVPYALKAADAATLGGLPASAFALAGTPTAVTGVTSNSITSDAVSNVTTTGGTNLYLPRFNTASTVVNSEIYDTGTSVGIGNVPNPGARLDVNGPMIMRGSMTVSRTGNATSSRAYPSYGFDFFSNAYNSSTKATDNPYFQLQSEPTGNNTATPSATFNLLFANNGGAIAETGFYINPNGTVHFASGQTFPGGAGTGTITGVTAGTGLSGGGTSGTVTLSVDPAVVPTLTGANTFTNSNTFGPSIFENTDVNIDSTNRNPGNISPGLRFGSASGEGMSSQRTSGTNQYGLDLYTGYSARLSILSSGLVGIGTRTPYAQLEADSQTQLPGLIATSTYADGADFIGGSNVDGQGNGGSGVYGYGGSVSGSMLISGAGGTFTGGSATEPTGAGYAAPGVYGSGGNDALGYGGYGGSFIGGYTNSSNGTPGEGLYATGGSNNLNGAQNPYAGIFDGNVSLSGTLYANAKNFQIDDPRDPANKYLNHSSVESSEMMNLYTGNVITDGRGVATVALPVWFETINGDFRYQLTILGKRAQAWISQEVEGGKFQISTDTPNVRVSWQITGIRHDPYAKAHPLVVEQDKDNHERGFYKNPELYGQPKEKQTEWGRHPGTMRQMEAMRQRRTALAKNSPGALGAQATIPSSTRP